MDKHLINNREQLPRLISRKLGRLPVQYAPQMKRIRTPDSSGSRRQPAGVLIPLCFRQPAGQEQSRSGVFVFQLIRRSSAVAQAGDVSGPGGMLSPRLDGVLRLPLMLGITPILRGHAGRWARGRGYQEFSAISLVLANALRESWEEIGLNPCTVSFLGPLPFQHLVLFKRTVFPVVGFIRKEWTFRPNHEVERVVEIPLEAFFQKDHYATLCVNDTLQAMPSRFTTNCLIWESPDGTEDVLWGVTLRIIQDFISVVFDVTPPLPDAQRTVSRTLSQQYLRRNGAV